MLRERLVSSRRMLPRQAPRLLPSERPSQRPARRRERERGPSWAPLNRSVSQPRSPGASMSPASTNADRGGQALQWALGHVAGSVPGWAKGPMPGRARAEPAGPASLAAPGQPLPVPPHPTHTPCVMPSFLHSKASEPLCDLRSQTVCGEGGVAVSRLTGFCVGS